MALTETLRWIVEAALGLRPAGRLPLRDFSLTDPPVTAVNEAKLFRPRDFSLAALHWTDADDDAAAQHAIDAMGLGLRWTARADRSAEVLAPTSGVMRCAPRMEMGQLVEQRLTMYLSDDDLAKLRARPTPKGEEFEVDNARFVCSMGPAQSTRLAQAMHAHHSDRRLEPVFAEHLDRARSLARIDGDVPADLNTAERLDLWLGGDTSVLWRFAAGVVQGDAGLGELADGDTLVLYAEVMGQASDATEPSWYRVNAGFVLDRLRTSGDGLQGEYDLLTEDYRERGVASAGTVSARSELCVVRGGSLGSVVLQPFGIVPAALFSFATSDPISVYAPALGDPVDRPMTLYTLSPTIPRSTLTRLWQTHGIQHETLVIGPTAVDEFPATDYPEQVRIPPRRRPDRPWGFYDDLLGEVTYGGMGWSGGAVGGTGTERTVIPHGEVASRPSHPRWTPKQALLLRRLYPLRFAIRLGTAAGTAHEFSVTQDERDCIRQEYVFHVYFTEPYFQTYRWLWNTQERAVRVFPTRDANHPHEVELDANDRPVRPAIGFNGVIRVPRRADLRPWNRRDTPYRHTLLVATADELLERSRTAAEAYAREVFRLLQAIADGVAPPVVAMPAYASEAVTRIVTLMMSPPLPRTSADGFLQVQLGARNPIAGIARVNAAGQFVLRPYRLQMSSGWRPPEYNETVSTTPISNHQLGEAMDIQPAGAGEGHRNPLALLCLHLAAQDFDDAGELRECLLENQAHEYIVSHVDNDKRARRIAENVLADGSRAYVLRAAGVADEPMSDVASLDGEPITGRTRLDVKVVQTYREEFDNVNGPATPWPQPTYLDMYIFGLCLASHVHHTWVL